MPTSLVVMVLPSVPPCKAPYISTILDAALNKVWRFPVSPSPGWPEFSGLRDGPAPGHQRQQTHLLPPELRRQPEHAEHARNLRRQGYGLRPRRGGEREGDVPHGRGRQLLLLHPEQGHRLAPLPTLTSWLCFAAKNRGVAFVSFQLSQFKKLL